MMELKALKKNFCKPESHLAIGQTVNDKLTEPLVLVQKKNVVKRNNTFYDNVLIFQKILGFGQVDDLGDCTEKIFNECDTEVDPANIEASHRLKPKVTIKKVIIKLSNIKVVLSILKPKNKLKSADIANVGLPQGLCSHYKYLWCLCKGYIPRK